jgi:hypothetical protein
MSSTPAATMPTYALYYGKLDLCKSLAEKFA